MNVVEPKNTQVGDCQCEEGMTYRKFSVDEFEGHQTPTGLHVHDCEYIRQRNKLVPLAASCASVVRISRKTGKEIISVNNRRFFEEMDRLWQEKGEVRDGDKEGG